MHLLITVLAEIDNVPMITVFIKSTVLAEIDSLIVGGDSRDGESARIGGTIRGRSETGERTKSTNPQGNQNHPMSGTVVESIIDFFHRLNTVFPVNRYLFVSSPHRMCIDIVCVFVVLQLIKRLNTAF